MVEECEVDGIVGGGGDFLGVFVCWYGMWSARMGKVYSQLKGESRKARIWICRIPLERVGVADSLRGVIGITNVAVHDV